MKIETSNPATSYALSGKENMDALKASVLPKETVGTAHPTSDNINISIPFSTAHKNLSTLLSNLIKLLNVSDDVLVGAGLKPDPPADTNAHDLIKVIDPLFYKGEEPVPFLKGFIEKSGLLYEAKISRGDIKGLEDDLKGLLLRVIDKQGEKTEAGKIAKTLLNDIEAKQLLNTKGKEEGVFHLQIPVLLPQGATTAEMQVRRDGKGNGEYKGDSHRVGFSIELREAGLVSVDALVRRSSVSIRLQVEKPEFLELMKTELPKLSERLSGYGLITSFE